MLVPFWLDIKNNLLILRRQSRNKLLDPKTLPDIEDMGHLPPSERYPMWAVSHTCCEKSPSKTKRPPCYMRSILF